MRLSEVSDKSLLSEKDVLKKMHYALLGKHPFSLVRIGDGENIVLGQNTFLKPQTFLNTYWVKESSQKDKSKGVVLPCLKLRDQMVESISKADIVGICRHKEHELHVSSKYKRELTDKIFEHYNISPKQLCHVFVNRKMISHRIFWEIIHNYRTILISKWANEYAGYITQKYLNLKPNIIGCIDFQDYHQIPETLEKLSQYQFDLALISTGVNAVVLAPKVAELYGKVAIDFGKTMMFTLQSNWKKVKPWKP
jgi:hypothetical protein